MASEKLQQYLQKSRVFILSSISDDPCDAQSLCRYLLYSNQFETEGLVACTSVRTKSQVYPQKLEAIIDAYAKVVNNLNKHVHPNWQYPAADHLKSCVRKGAETYGMTAINPNASISPGAQFLYERILAPSTQPLWILCWGGASTLAQALGKLNSNFPVQDLRRLLSRIRVYSISDQDDTGAWIRNHYPDIFYIASVHGWNQHGMATWTGISGEKYYNFDYGGPNSEVMEKKWIKDNVQLGPFGSAYPDYVTIPESASPTFLYLIQNGLGSPEHPEFGSWGGRYARTDISSDGLDSNHYSDVVDHVKVGGETYTSNHATIWRWREAFQNDFAARIKWSMEPGFSKANHHPVITINGVKGLKPVRIDIDSNSVVALDASGTYDPDGKKLTYSWWHYREPSATQWEIDVQVPALEIQKMDTEGQKVEVKILSPEKQSAAFVQPNACTTQQLHVILEVMNDGVPALTSYRRVLMQVLFREAPASQGVIDGLREGVKKL